MMNGTIGTHDGIGTPPTPAATDTCLGGLSVAEAAVSLGVSVNTIRRWIKEGRVRSERVDTSTGYAYRVFPDREPVNGTHANGGTASGTHTDAGNPVDQPVAGSSVALETQRAEAMAVYTRTLLEPLVTRLSEQETTIRAQAETIGRQGAELERAASALVAAESALSASDEATASERRRARLLGLLLATLALLAPVGVVVGTLVLAGRMS